MQQYAVYIYLLQGHSTCFGCRPHPSSGVRKTVVSATGSSHMIVQLPHSNVAKLATLEWGSCPICEYFLWDFTCYTSKLTVIYDLYQWL